MRAYALALLAAAVLLLAGCGEPIPLDRMAYAGDWRSRDMRLLITPDGRCEYRRRREGGSTSSISAPIVRFEGDNFVVGLGMLSTTFVVSKPPHLIDGHWHMTVDGVDLIRFGPSDEIQA
jgi:hypothetical protein